MKRSLFDSAVPGRKTRLEAADLDITPMIDVTFLLLIFFMVTSTMQATPDVPLPVARYGDGIRQNQQVIVSIIDVAGQPVLIAGDAPGAEQSLDEILQFARNEIQTGKTGILLKASGRVPTGFIKQVTQKLQTIGELEFYYGVSEKQ